MKITNEVAKIRATFEENNDKSRAYFKARGLERKRKVRLRLIKKVVCWGLVVMIVAAIIYLLSL